MKRNITLLVCAVIAMAMIFGACSPTQQPNTSASPTASASAGSSDATTDSGTVTIGEIDGKPVYKSDLEAWLNMMGYGTDMLTDPNYSDMLPDIIDSFMTVEVINAEIVKRGYMDKLTSDQLAQAAEYAQSDIDSSVQNYGMTEEEFLSTIGLTKDELIEQYKLNIAGNAAFTDLVGDVKPSEEQLRKEFDDTVASQKEEMDADATAYVSDVNSGTDVYYAPAGVRMVSKLLIAIDSDTADAISLLRDQGYNEQADTLLTNALASIKSKADEAADKLDSGMSFKDAMDKYNEDANAVEGGYPVVAGTTDYPAAFTEKAMALTSVGQISDMFSTDEGYLILEYTSDVTPGTADYESVKDKVSQSMLTSVQTDAWTTMVDQWKTEHNIKTYPENL